jgi:hypothetical protein
MPTVRIVVLDYVPGAAFGPSPAKVPAAPGDTIVFRTGTQTRADHPGCKLRITIHNAQHFSQQVLVHSPNQTGAEDLSVQVLPGPLAGLVAAAAASGIISGYGCELLDSTRLPLPGFTADGAAGGEIVPDSGNQLA